MAKLTPAGKPAGRFPSEQHAALDAVFAAAAPFPPDNVDALIEALGNLDAYVQLNSLAAQELTASNLSLRFHAIASAAEELLQKLGISEGMPRQIRRGLEYFAQQEAMKNAGGFPNHPPKIFRIRDDEKDNLTRYYEERQLQDNIEGIFQISRWARQAEGKAKRAPRRADKNSKKAACTTEELVHLYIGKGPEFDICNEIFDIWIQILERPLRTSTRSRDGAASGPLIRFTKSCWELLGLSRLYPLTDNAIRARSRRYRRSN